MKKKRQHSLSAFLAMSALCLIAALTACKPSKGQDEVVSEHKMEAILYDYHIAQGLAQLHPGDALIMLKYQTAILEKHGVSQEQFDTSLAYYMRHTEQMHAIYERLSNRLSDEAVAQGSSLSEVGKGGEALMGDTANIWKGQTAMVLNPHPPFNRLDFSIKGDTTFHAGDRVMLDFDAQFIYQDGIRDAIVMLAMRLANDSVVTRTIHASSTSHYSLNITDEGRIGIKSVNGFFLLPASSDNASSQTTLHMALFTGIRLKSLPTAPQKATGALSSADGDTIASEPDRRSFAPPSEVGKGVAAPEINSRPPFSGRKTPDGRIVEKPSTELRDKTLPTQESNRPLRPRTHRKLRVE